MKQHLEDLTIQEKALKLNLQPSIYGVFAEIGAGQEVANHFFKAGAASGTIAKTISAYDMTVSDTVYGRTEKYVSKDRVESMLDVEYEKLVASLSTKSSMKNFFVFSNSIETINFQKTNKGQGWLGVKFQLTPSSPPSTCIIHVIFHVDDVNEQRKIVGDLGVNLIYGAYEYTHSPELFVENLKQNINTDYLEINFIELEGSQFDKNISLQLSLQLVKSGLTKMIMLGTSGEILQPSNALYKKDVLLIRGRFRPPTKVTEEMFLKSKNQLVRNNHSSEHNVLAVAEITFKCFQERTELSLNDFLDRTKLISELGYPLMITNFTYHHELISFMNDVFRLNSLNIVLGLDNLRKVTKLERMVNVEENVLKLLLSMSSENNRILAFPELDRHGELSGLENLKLDPAIQNLFNFLKSTNRIEEIEEVDKNLLSIRSDKVLLAAITNKDDEWRASIPERLLPVFDQHIRMAE